MDRIYVVYLYIRNNIGIGKKITIINNTMPKEIKIKKTELTRWNDPNSYISVFAIKYYKVWNDDPQNLFENLTQDQIILTLYNILFDQVQNGGFLQLIFNGYDYMIKEGSPIPETLREWGAAETANVLAKIAPHIQKVSDTISESEWSVENLSKLYKQFPEFNEFDEEFYNNDGSLEVKKYVEENLSKFATIVE